MTELLTSAQMRAIDAAAIASGEVTGLELMERAGQGVVDAILEEWPSLRSPSHRAVVLCGPGNNGGDGFVVARLLKECGWAVDVFLCGDPVRMPPDARVNHERWLKMGEVRPWPCPDDDVSRTFDPWACDLIVDAVFGTGLTRAVSFGEANFGRMLPEWDLRDEPGRPKVVAVDVPSGMCADSGRRLADSDALWADLTVTFHCAKVGHFLCEGEFLSGKVVVVPIGLGSYEKSTRQGAFDPTVVDRDVSKLRLVNRPQPWALAKAVGWGRPAHKYSHGHALILSGPSGRGGATRLAARGALRVGAGVVTVGCPAEALAENAARLDAVMLRGVADADALAEALEDKRINALCLGPGMGTGVRQAELVATALQGRGDPRPTVLDADALTILSRRPDLVRAVHRACILTPHAGEFARLFPDLAERLTAPAAKGPAYSKVDAAREAAARSGCVVLYKGADTVIAGPDGICAINSAQYDRGAPWLATAGSGDVLAGFITGLVARGFAPFDAACTGAWLHVECARSFGPGLIAEDLPDELPKVFRALGL